MQENSSPFNRTAIQIVGTILTAVIVWLGSTVVAHDSEISATEVRVSTLDRDLGAALNTQQEMNRKLDRLVVDVSRISTIIEREDRERSDR